MTTGKQGSREIEIRPWGEGDSLEDLTALLNRAYAPLSAAGFRYVASWQDVEITRRRLSRGECWLAMAGERIIGAILLCMPPPHPVSPVYERDDLAMFQQFAVAPERQGEGIGGALIAHVELRATELGARTLAFDTAEGASRLIAWYQGLGYRFIDYCDWEVTNYRSVIYGKSLQGESSGEI
jgi:GNAT superfamily N-acetyltransferase